jgi:hypothetical protein
MHPYGRRERGGKQKDDAGGLILETARRRNPQEKSACHHFEIIATDLPSDNLAVFNHKMEYTF